MEEGRPPGGEPVAELLLVKLRPGCRPGHRERVERAILAWGGQLMLSADWGWIAHLDQAAKPLLRADRAVALVGGVQPPVRRIPRIQVPADRV